MSPCGAPPITSLAYPQGQSLPRNGYHNWCGRMSFFICSRDTTIVLLVALLRLANFTAHIYPFWGQLSAIVWLGCAHVLVLYGYGRYSVTAVLVGCASETPI
jgi:hypothetical protein